jgi:ribose 5-phosphate isomerase A
MLAAYAAEAGCEGEIKLRLGKDGAPVLTDSGNLLLDCAFGRIDKPEMLDDALKRVPGVVEHGLFLGIADVAIVAGADGVVVLERDDARKDR